MSKYTVCRQEWRHFPKVLVMRNVETGEERRYVPESEDTSEDIANALLSGYSLGLSISSENAKLRELVRDMVKNIGGCALRGEPLRLQEFGIRAKELGVIE